MAPIVQKEKFVYTTAIKRLRKIKKRIRVIPGGSSAGKTFGILPILIDKAIAHEGLEISVVSESVPHLRRGALKDFEKIMRLTNRWQNDGFNKQTLTYRFKNGSYIEFFSADQDSKVRGARRNILYINECNNVKFDTYYELAIRTNMEVWLDFNPTNEFWAHEELRDDEDAEWLTLTYKDNEALSPDIVKELEKSRTKGFYDPMALDLFSESNIKNPYWSNRWRVYGLGLVGSLEGVVFKDWDIVDRVPTGSRLLGYTMDFGYTNDPTAIYAVYRSPDKRIVFDELCYRKGMKNSDIAALLRSKGVRSGDTIVADSSEPKSIAEINGYGFRIRGVKKGKDSIMFGITTLQEIDFSVTKRSTNLIDELRKYAWDKDDSGSSTNKPIDMFNHGIDAIRYFAMTFLSKRMSSRKKGLRARN